jgi:hypothetical protein
MAYGDLDYNATDAYLTEEERRRRAGPTVNEALQQGLDRFTGRFTDANGDFSMGKYLAGQLAGGGGPVSPQEQQLLRGAGVPDQPGFITGSRPGVAPAVPVQPQQQIPTAYAAGAQPVQQPNQFNSYAERVAANESGAGGYDAIYGFGNPGGDPSIPANYGGRNLSQITIGEALNIGDSRMNNNSGALGKYQFLPSTIRGLVGPAGLSENDTFDAVSAILDVIG